MDGWEPPEATRGGTNGPNATVLWLFEHNLLSQPQWKGGTFRREKYIGQRNKMLTLRLL